jgi:retron-type reverse transcriptase
MEDWIVRFLLFIPIGAMQPINAYPAGARQGGCTRRVKYILREKMNSIERKEFRYTRRREKRDRKTQEFLTQYDDFSLITDPNNLLNAYRKSKLEVSWKESVQRYDMNLLSNIAETQRKLIEGKNVSHGFVEFDLNERGKKRHIKSIHISERVVQKCLCDKVLVPIMSRSLIYDNGASLKNRGLHFAIRRLKTHLSKYYRHNGNEGYCLSIDFSKYFDSIRHDLLLEMVGKLIHDERIMKLYKEFILPFGEGKSLGLGSQVSQISAIYFPNKLDHSAKEKHRIKYYGRYMDDMYLIHNDKEYLKKCLSNIEEICNSLGIIMNKRKTKIVKLKDGIKFLKGVYSLNENGKIICRADPDSRKRMRRNRNRSRGY